MKTLLVAGSLALGAFGFSVVAPTGVGAVPEAHAAGSDGPLYVTSVTPSRDQHVFPDLSNPGVNSVVTVRFSAPLDARGVVDPHDPGNGLGVKCDFHIHTLAAIPVSASVRRNILTLDPFSARVPVLAQGRYTLTLKSSVRSASGRLLNGGGRGFTTTFYIGSQTSFPPVLLRISPIAGRAGVEPRRAVVATFDAPIDEASAAAAIRLEDRSADPPTPIPARVRLARRGFAVVVTPAASSGYPRGAHVALVIAGEGRATAPSAQVLTEVEGHKFTRDRGASWTVDPLTPTLFHSVNGEFDDVTGEFTLEFRTRGVAVR